ITLGSGWPFGGPHIPVTQAAGKLRVVQTPIPAGADSLAVPSISSGEELLAAFLIDSGHVPNSFSVLNLSEVRNGRVNLPNNPTAQSEIGRASCRERREITGGDVAIRK